MGTADPILTEWIDAGVVVTPVRQKTALPPSPVTLEEGAALRLLDEARDDKGV